MSSFEDYDTTFKSYNVRRVAAGSDVITALLSFHSKKALEDIHILDAGCGTGNYARALLDYGVGKITLLDASSGMLSAAKQNVSEYVSQGKVADAVEAKLPLLPFADSSFDVVMFNFVLHHLINPNGSTDLSKFRKAIAEARRVLKLGGILFITTSLPTNVQNWWYYHLSKSVLAKYERIWPSLQEYKETFLNDGLQLIQQIGLPGVHVLNEYDNLDGPLSEEWRKADSFWAMGTTEEIENVVKFVNDLKQRGELENFKLNHDKLHSDGLVALLVCKAVYANIMFHKVVSIGC